MENSKEKLENVVSLNEERIKRTKVGKITEACDQIHDIIGNIIYKENIPAHEILLAVASRLGWFLGYTNADLDTVPGRFARIIKNSAEKIRKS